MTNEKNNKRDRTRRWDFWTFIQNKLRSKKDTIYKEHRFKMLMWCKQNMKPMFVILLYIVIHIQIPLPHLKYRLCLLSFLSPLAMEWVGPSTRTYAGLIIAFFGPVGELYLELIAYLTREWFWIVIGVAVPFVLVFILYWYGSWIIHLVEGWSIIAIFRLYLSS